jgi:hypothetical protein
VPRLWRSGMLRNRVPALPGWADLAGRPYGPGDLLFGLRQTL